MDCEKIDVMSTLHDIQLAIKARLEAARYFAGIGVLTQNEGDYDTAVTLRLNRLGLSCLVMLAGADVDDPAQTGPYFDNIKYVVEVAEFVTRNRSPQGSRKPLLDVGI